MTTPDPRRPGEQPAEQSNPYGSHQHSDPSAQHYGQHYGQPHPEQHAGESYSGQFYGQQHAQQPYGGYGQYQAYGPYQQPHQQYGDPRYPHYPYGAAPYWPPAPPAPKRKVRRGATAVGAAIVLAAATVTGVALASGGNSLSGSGGSLFPSNGSDGSGNSGGTLPGNGSGNGSGSGGSQQPGGTSTSAGLATEKQQKGIVTIVSVLKYQNAESAGTGMILSSDGEILTNNHVINGATSVTVTVESTGKSYRADVVGTVPTQDVAVLKLRDASGLTKANVGDSDDVKVGDAVTGVGNAGGTGTLRAASGKVTALNQTITASDENGSSSERLTGLIGINAPIISGDSGGPLYDSYGDIVGMNTAASPSSGRTSGPNGLPGATGGGQGGQSSDQSSAYAITIDKAESLADQIESGQESSTVHIGPTPFIGVSVTDANGAGAGITSVVEGGPAANAGITPGSVITAVGGTKVSDAASLKTALAQHDPGDSVTLTWTEQNGGQQQGKTTLIAGPAD